MKKQKPLKLLSREIKSISTLVNNLQNMNLKNKNSVLERQVAKLKNKCLNLNII